jgi:L-alanine-DL-glutamate epimerase-like enolase superfamily enzyme
MPTKIERVHVRVFTHTTRKHKDIDGHTHPGPPVPTRSAVLTLEADNGVEGHAIGAPELVRPELLDAYVRPTLLGQDALNREALWRKLAHWQRGSGGAWHDRALALVDCALWDLNGRLLGAPVWQLAGGCRERVPAYASTMCGDDIPGGLATPEDYGRFAEQLKRRGYQAIKLHTWMPPIAGAPSVKMDIAACAAVREAVGPEMPLMLDANHWYSRAEALELGRAIERLGYTWFEEPMEESSPASYRWLAQQLGIAVCGPESAWGKHQMRAEWAASGACDILRTGVHDVGGLTPALKCMHLAESFNMDCEVHGTGLANLAVSAACGNSRWYERGLLHPHLDYDEPPEYLKRLSDPMDEQGFVHLPTEAGLGEAIDWVWIEAHTQQQH